jgi:hydroxyacylglutathione hydrolase
MNVFALPTFSDNDIWMLHDGVGAAVIDPGDADPVLAVLDAHGLTLRAILVTPHHRDHVAGVLARRTRLQGSVYGPANEQIPRPFEPLRERDSIRVPGLQCQVLGVPGHTAGHIAYVVRHDDGAPPWQFCGDRLFSAGCGRLSEGTPAQMCDSPAHGAGDNSALQVFAALCEWKNNYR